MTLEELAKKPKLKYTKLSHESGVNVLCEDNTEIWLTEYDYWELRQLQLGEVFQNADITREELKERYGSNLNY